MSEFVVGDFFRVDWWIHWERCIMGNVWCMGWGGTHHSLVLPFWNQKQIQDQHLLSLKIDWLCVGYWSIICPNSVFKPILYYEEI